MIFFLHSEVMALFATPQAARHKGGITIVLRNAGGHSCSIPLYRGFSEFCRSSTVSLDCRTLVAIIVSISVKIRQAPSTFHP